MKRAIFDTNVAIATVIELPSTEAAVRALRQYEAHAPEQLVAEAANVMRRLVRVGSIADEKARDALLFVLDGVTVHAMAPLTERAYALSAAFDHSVYDCFSLALAEREGCPLLSGDAKFLKMAAPSATVPLLDIAQLPEVLP